MSRKSRPLTPPRYILVPSALHFEQPRLPDYLLCTYEVVLALAWANDYVKTPPISAAQLAAFRGVSERTIRRHLAELEQRRYLAVEGSRAALEQVYYPQVRSAVGTASSPSRNVPPQARHTTPDDPHSRTRVTTSDTGDRGIGNNHAAAGDRDSVPESIPQQQQIFSLLTDFGIERAKARELVRKGVSRRDVEGWIAYARLRTKRADNPGGLENPQGFVVRRLEQRLPPPRLSDEEQRALRLLDHPEEAYITGEYAKYIRH